MPSHYQKELRERAIHLAVEARQEPTTKPDTIDRITTQPGVITLDTMYSWFKQAEKYHRIPQNDAATQVNDAERIRKLEQENFGLRSANTILKQALAFSLRS